VPNQRISHPNVVNYLSSFSTCSHHCLVLEKVSGGELFELLQRPGYHAKMGEDFVRRVFGELARCVGWLHEAGVVHRDLKLESESQRCRAESSRLLTLTDLASVPAKTFSSPSTLSTCR
jgi:serine/threonine protein kinase